MSRGFGPTKQPTSRYGTHFQFALILCIVVELIFVGVLLVDKLGTDKAAHVKDATTASAPIADGPQHTTQSLMPPLRTDIVLGNRSFITDIDFLPTGELLFTERRGSLNIVRGSQTYQLGDIRDVQVSGASGLLGVAVDPAYATNGFIYVCFNSSAGDIRVTRSTVSADATSLMPSKDVVTGLTANNASCDLGFAADGKLWVHAGKRVVVTDREGASPSDSTQKYPPLTLNGSQWQKWNGAVLTTVPSDQYLRVRAVDTERNISSEEHILRSGFGQLQAMVQGNDGALYVGTANGGDDKIIRVSPDL
jgi:glucose/arabinose dehydrogenase